MEFVDTLLDILEKTEDDDLGRGFLTEHMFNFPSNQVNNEVRNALNEMFKTKNKSLYVCGHQGCTDKSIFSHEMTENVFLKQLANNQGMVLELTPDFKKNALKSWFKPVHKGNATNFPGYCREHDRSIFEDIEAPFPGFTEHFYAKYCLRLIRRDLFELDRKIKMCNELISNVCGVENDEAKLFINQIEQKKELNLKRKERALAIYNELFDSIENQKSYLEFHEFDVKKAGYCFSKMFDFTLDSDEEFAVLFIIKLEHDKMSKFVLAHIKNDISRTLSSDLEPKGNHGLWLLSDMMLNYKEHFVFSHHFRASLDEHTNDIMTRNHDIFSLSIIDKLLLSQVFF